MSAAATRVAASALGSTSPYMKAYTYLQNFVPYEWAAKVGLPHWQFTFIAAFLLFAFLIYLVIACINGASNWYNKEKALATPKKGSPVKSPSKLDTFTSMLKSPLQLLSPAKATAAPDEDDEEDEIDAYLAWEEEVNAMSTADLKQALLARKLSPFGSARVLSKRLIEAGPEIELFEVVTSGNVTIDEDVELEIEETPAAVKRSSRKSTVKKSSVKKTPAATPQMETVTSSRSKRSTRKAVVLDEIEEDDEEVTVAMTPAQANKMTVADLKKALLKVGASPFGAKSDLVERLTSASKRKGSPVKERSPSKRIKASASKSTTKRKR